MLSTVPTDLATLPGKTMYISNTVQIGFPNKLSPLKPSTLKLLKCTKNWLKIFLPPKIHALTMLVWWKSCSSYNARRRRMFQRRRWLVRSPHNYPWNLRALISHSRLYLYICNYIPREKTLLQRPHFHNSQNRNSRWKESIQWQKSQAVKKQIIHVEWNLLPLLNGWNSRSNVLLVHQVH